jgi:hypothetical protein
MRAPLGIRVKNYGIDFVIEYLDGTNLDKEKMKKKYLEFKEIYIEIIK